DGVAGPPRRGRRGERAPAADRSLHRPPAPHRGRRLAADAHAAGPREGPAAARARAERLPRRRPARRRADAAAPARGRRL
ncbi:MAG: hypothetical protein AVDCRST_MAG30-1072, partial [uncultured Solirubrobacteraceae bacterium]